MTAKFRALIADDQNVVRKAMRRILERMGDFEIHEFSSGKDSLQFLKENNIQLALVDIYMPNGNGFEILSYIRSRPIANDIPVIIVSGEATKDDIVQSVDLGATDYILKPFEPNEFTNKVNAVLKAYQNPNERILKIREAESCLIEGDLDKAEALLNELKTLDATQPRVLVGFAQLLQRRGKMQEALDYVKQSVAANPMFFPAYSIGANIALKQGNKDDAIEFLNKELSINGKQGGRRAVLADLFAAKNDFNAAQEQIRLALLNDPKNEQFLLKMADLQFKSGDAEKSVHYYLKTRRQNPTSQKALDGVIDVCIKSKREKHAENILTDLIKLNPNQKDLLFGRAKFFERTKDYERCLKDVQAYMDACGENLDGLKMKGIALAELGRAEEAFVVWEKIVKAQPTADNYGKFGLIAIKVNNLPVAIKCYQIAIKSDAYNPKYFFNLGYAYELSSQIPAAKQAYERAHTLDPENKEAKQACLRLGIPITTGRKAG